MVKGFFGKKIGMTQIFSGNDVIPVTAVDVAHWFILALKTEDKDGYNAVQVGKVRKRYEGQAFSAEWLKKLKKYFVFVREVKVNALDDSLTVGKEVAFHDLFADGSKVDVSGTTKGCGFAGVVKRHNFAGGPSSHGSTMGNRTGSIGFMCKCGKVIKGKKMPGHMGVNRRTQQGLSIVAKKDTVVFIKGSIPGKAGSLVYVGVGVKA